MSRIPDFDTDTVCKHAEGSTSVHYSVYNNPDTMPANEVERMSIVEVKKKFRAHFESNICYGSMKRRIETFTFHNDGLLPNRVMTMFGKDRSWGKGQTLSIEDKKEWIRLCSKYKMVPSYINESIIDDGVFIIKVDNKLAPSVFFLYASVIREIWKAPAFVKAVLYLVNDKHMNFYLAFVVASRFCLGGSDAHCTFVQRKYGGPEKINNSILVPLHVAMGLKRFVHNPRKYDNRRILDKSWNGTFLTSRTLSYNTTKLRCNISVGETLKSRATRAVNAKTDEKSMEYAKTLNPSIMKIVKSSVDKEWNVIS